MTGRRGGGGRVWRQRYPPGTLCVPPPFRQGGLLLGCGVSVWIAASALPPRNDGEAGVGGRVLRWCVDCRVAGAPRNDGVGDGERAATQGRPYGEAALWRHLDCRVALALLAMTERRVLAEGRCVSDIPPARFACHPPLGKGGFCWGVAWVEQPSLRAKRGNPETEAGMIGVLRQYLDCRVGFASSQ